MEFRATISRRLFVAASVSAALILSVSTGFAESGPFAGMSGVWKGRGTIELDGGNTENIRCRATYAVSSNGQGLNQTLLCASDSYKFELKSDVVAKGGALSGTWSETTRNVGGSLTGQAGNGQFNVDVSAPTFAARLKLTTRGDRQNVVISSDGQFKGAKISLTRS